MTLLDTRDHYKPFSYPWAFEGMQAQEESHWNPTEISLQRDINDWKTLSMSDQNFLTQIFRFFTQADVDVAAGYYEKFIPIFPQPELRMMMGKFAAMEGTHIWAYSLLLDTVGMPETEYQAFQEYKAMAAKHEYLNTVDVDTWYIRQTSMRENTRQAPGHVKELAKSIAIYSAFTEGLQLFSSFVMLLNFPRHGLMKGMGEIVTWSIRDESIHVEYMTKLFRTFIQENMEIWTDDFKAELYQACRDMVELEDRFIDLAFELGPVRGLSSADVKQFVRYIADRRLLQLGLKTNYGVKENPLPWYDELLNSVGHTNFFEGRATEYSKGSYVDDLVKGYKEKVND